MILEDGILRYPFCTTPIPKQGPDRPGPYIGDGGDRIGGTLEAFDSIGFVNGFLKGLADGSLRGVS